MLDWYHECAVEWLEARRKCITATELIGLIPEYKKAKKAGKLGTILPSFAALWEKKHSEEALDNRSYKDAARGHIMEPYAVESYNMGKPAGEKMNHWDDFIIINQRIGFSPDALDIPQPEGFECKPSDLKRKPKAMLEIKSYGVDHHIKAMLSDKMDLPERFQIAVGMIVCKSIQVGYLMLFNPAACHQCHVKTYTRKDLEDEINILCEVISEWNSVCKLMGMNKFDCFDTEFTEKQIWEENHE